MNEISAATVFPSIYIAHTYFNGSLQQKFSQPLCSALVFVFQYV